jgi:hypothetical protein
MRRLASLLGSEWLFPLLSIVLLFPIIMSAQFDTATVLGTVRDATGAVVPSVSIALKNVGTNITATTQTDAAGDFIFPNVRIGMYEMVAEHAGLTTVKMQNINVTVNARQRIDFTLEVRSVSESVEVTASAALLETDSSSKGQVIQQEQITNLPLNGRSYSQLALLAPGVNQSLLDGIGTGGREGSFNVNGLRSTFNNFMLDGLDNNQYGSSNQGFSNQVIQVSPDAIAEFRLDLNTYSAEYGRSGGAVVNASYRSGTNEYHGSLWEYLRNTDLNATGFFKPASGVKPVLNRNQFGGTFGGPILRNRTFFFLDYEGYRQVQQTVTFSTIPTMAQRAGILTVPVVNPLTGASYPAGTPIPMTAFASKVLNDLPAPNLAGTANNWVATVPNRDYYDKANLRFDHRFNDKLNVFARLSQLKDHAFVGPGIPGPSGGNANGSVIALNQQLALGATLVPNSTSVLEFRLGISRGLAGKRPVNIGSPGMLALYGIPGLPSDPSIAGGLTDQAISGYSQLGQQSTSPQFQNPSNVDPRLSYTWNHGRNTVKAGAEVLFVDVEVQDTNPLNGIDSYSGQLSRPAGVASNNLYNLADFFFGARNQYQLANEIVAQTRRRGYFGYVQDDMRVTSKLTFNVGLRYEFVTPWYEAQNRMSNFDPATASMVQAKPGSIYERSLVQPDRNNFAPRLGFAYNLGKGTVIRGGYGIGYIYFNRVASAELLATNYPQVTRSTITQGTTAVVNGVTQTLPVCTGNQYVGCFRPTQAGYPTGLPNAVTLYVPSNMRNGYVQNWQLSIQRKLTSNTVLDVGYVGNHALKLVLLGDLNQATPPLPGQDVSQTLQARRPIAGYGSISAVLPEGFSNYNGFVAKIEHRASKGLYILNSFTWSKAMSNSSQVLDEVNGSTAEVQNIHNIAADKGLAPYNMPIMNTTSVVWDIPVGRGQAFAKDLPAFWNTLIGGWKVDAINSMHDGLPINFRYGTAGPTPVGAGLATFLGDVALRPNITGAFMTPSGARTIDNYFNSANVVIPAATQPFGNAGRNIARAGAIYQLDMGLQKLFYVPRHENMRFEFRGEAFNLLNKTNFLAATGDRSSGAFGTIRSTTPARQVQFALKFSF